MLIFIRGSKAKGLENLEDGVKIWKVDCELAVKKARISSRAAALYVEVT
jgi:hypothetical protein